MSALFDFPSLLVVILLFICCMSYIKRRFPQAFDSQELINYNKTNNNNMSGTRDPNAPTRSGLYSICWKMSRIGDRLSPYVGAACVVMAIHLLFIKK